MCQHDRFFRRFRTVVLLLMFGPLGMAVADNPAAEETPWGKEEEGLSCRLILAQPSICQGQAVPVAMEIRNRSDQVRTLLHPHGSYWAPHHRVALARENPTHLQAENNYPGDDLRVGAFTTINPGQKLRFEISNLQDRRGGSLALGKYGVSYRYSSVKPGNLVARELQNLWVGTLVSATAPLEVREPTKDDLTVHEWGVFKVYPELKYANADLKKEWETMPDFFYRQFPELRLKRPLVPVAKPIVYFHTKTPGMAVQVQVAFTEGAPVVWWPCCSLPMHPFAKPAKPEIYRQLQWNAWVGNQIPTSFGSYQVGKEGKLTQTPQFLDYPAGSWLQQARLDQAAAVTVWGTPVKAGRPFEQQRLESERFIFYDGLLPAPDFIRCPDAAGASLSLKNEAPFAITDLFIVDRRATAKEGKVRFAHLSKVGAREPIKADFTEVASKDWPATGVREVHQALLQVGLNEAEAKSLLAIWNDSFFQANGVTVFHLLPPAEYERRLPMQITPKPGEVVRVGIILYPQIDLVPGAARRVAELIRQLDDAKFQVREQATRDLVAMGPHAFPLVRKALEARPSLEQQTRLEKVLRDAGDATIYLPLTPTGR